MERDNKSLPFRFPARPRDAKRESQPPYPGEFESFVRTKVKLFQRNPPSPSQYNREEDRYKPNYEEAREDLKRIFIAHDEDPETTLMAKECSWNTVFDQMAEVARLASSKGGLGVPALAVGMEIGSEVVDMFPEEFGLGLIKGGLALVFEACQRRSEIRQNILDAFQTVPDAILTISTAYVLLDPEDVDKDILRAFFLTLVEDLPFLIKKLLGNEKWYEKIASALLLHIPQKFAVDDILSDWTMKMATLKERVQGMKIKILGKLGRKLDDLKYEVDSSEVRIVASIKRSNDALKDQIMNSEAGIIALLSEHRELIQLTTTQIQHQDKNMRAIGAIAAGASAAAMTGLIREAQYAYMQLKREQEEKDKLDQKLKRKEEELDEERDHFRRELEHSHRNEAQLRRDGELYQRENTKLHVQNRELSRQISSQSLNNQVQNTADTNTSVTPMDVLGAIGLPPNAMWRDLEQVVRRAIHFDAESYGKAQWLLKTSEFNSWMQNRQSSILISDGATTGQVLLVSPISSLCAALASGLADVKSRTITLSFFAGLHVNTDPNSYNLNGPQGMMRTLVAQLVTSALLEPNLEFMTPDSLQIYQRHDLKLLCDLFVRLMNQLSPGIDVFCIIDGISWYEQAPWLAGLRSVTGMFEYLMSQLQPKDTAILKVLMTSHGRSTEIVHRARGGKNSRFWRHVTLAAGHVHSGASITGPQNRNRNGSY
ncbi:hypothetical protein F5Y10DRAFT_270133 [Nemania abortiva]|nr:hypothetical protein F5Y10DRAFT_270133 [Nemania abortiva]